jgi:hypothetical protein
MLENLHMTQGNGAGQSAQNKALNQQMQKFGALMGKQRALLDKTFRQRQGQADPKDGGAQGLQKQQQELQKQLQDSLKGMDGKSAEKLREAGKAMGEAQDALGRPVVSLRLVDPRFYHLDVALAAIDDANVAYFPGAFAESSQRVLRQLFPSAVLADEEDALAFGLNLVSDGRNVVLNSEADGLAAKLAAAGYAPVPVELGELKKGGGSVKCCIAELFGMVPPLLREDG